VDPAKTKLISLYTTKNKHEDVADVKCAILSQVNAEEFIIVALHAKKNMQVILELNHYL